MTYPTYRDQSKVTAHYKDARRPGHYGIDIAPKVPGTKLPLFAVDDGVVSHVNIGGWRAGKNVAITLDGDNSIWWYGHMSRIDVKVGDRVQNGEHATQLGLMGNTGFAFGVHTCLKRFANGILDNHTNPWGYIKSLLDPRRRKAAGQAQPAPAPAPAPSINRALRVGARVRLSTPWVRFKYPNLTTYMNPNTLRAGDYRVVDVRNGNAMLESTIPGYVAQGWVDGSALVKRGGIIG